MKNKNLWIGGLIVLLIIIGLVSINNKSNMMTSDENSEEATSTSKTTSPKTTASPQKSSPQTVATKTTTEPLPDIEFINQRTNFALKDYPNVKFTIEKVVFGRGDNAVSSGCKGVPNNNFSTYLYPGDGICLGEASIDGVRRGIVAFHILIDNKSNIGFGGNSDVLKLHYLRAEGGEVKNKFAYVLNGLSNYYINSYSSKEVILSYLVPEDQLLFNFVGGYKEPSIETKGSLNIYDYSTNGLYVDFMADTLKIAK